VTGTNGRPGEITIASCCEDVETGPTSRIETIGVDPGGADINILTCCERGYDGQGGDIVINGLVLAQHKYGLAPTINVVALVGGVLIDGTNQFGIETVNGTAFNRTSGLLVHTVNGTDGGDINVQARDTVNVLGNKQFLVPNRVNFGAIAIKTNNTNGQGGNGTIDVRSLEGGIRARDRSFDLENRFNHAINTFINLSALNNILLGDLLGSNFVVSSQGGSGGQGGANTIHSFAGQVMVLANAEVLANAPGGTNGTNDLTGCGLPGVTIDPSATVNQADANPGNDAAGCGAGPVPLFTNCQRSFGVVFEHVTDDA
jgi:hypothetical protein